SQASKDQSAGENLPPTAATQPESSGTQASGPNVDLPPGFGVAGAPPQPQPSGEPGSAQDTMAPTPQAAPASPAPSEAPEQQASTPASQDSQTENTEQKQAALGNESALSNTDSVTPATPLPAPPAHESGSDTVRDDAVRAL